GTASDAAGVVGGVEVSVDNGATWRRATGTATWTYSWVPGVLGAATIKARATDDSLNTQVTVPSVAVTIVEANCPCSLWPGTRAKSAASSTASASTSRRRTPASTPATCGRPAAPCSAR